MTKKDYEKFEDFLLTYLRLKEYIESIEKDTFTVRNIDSKNKKSYRTVILDTNTIKNKVNIYKDIIEKNYIKCINWKILIPHKSSFLKWDILYEWKYKNIIIDAKDYKEIEWQMKFPFKDKKDNFIKTIDSNIKYLLFLPFVYEIEELRYLLCKIFKKEEVNVDNIHDFSFFISKEQFSKLFKIFEFWCMYNELNITWKYIISNNKKDNTIVVQNISNFKTSNKIKVKFQILNNNYLYLNFYDNNNLFYSISQRSFKEWYKANCSFINKDYIKTYVIEK